MRVRIESPTNIIVKIVKPVSIAIESTGSVNPRDSILLPTAFVGVKVLFADYSHANFASASAYEVFYRAVDEANPSTSEVHLTGILKEVDGVTFTSPLDNTRVAWGVFAL